MRCSLSVVSAAVAVLMAIPASGTAQEPVAPQTSAATFKAGVEATSIPVTVRDPKGRVVTGLTKNDFELIDTGFGRQITSVFSGEGPISLGILLDISGSMAISGNIDRARHAIGELISRLQVPGDEVAFYTFDSKLREVVPFTTDLDVVRRINLEGRPWGTTSLFDSIGTTAQATASRSNPHRGIVVITDGVDTASRMTPQEVSSIAAGIDVPVSLLIVLNPIDVPDNEAALLTAGDKSARVGTLADLAHWTGGTMWLASEPAQNTAAVGDLVTELRHQYVMSFEPGPRPGWHPLEIRIRNRKSLVVRARSGYLVDPAPVEK